MVTLCYLACDPLHGGRINASLIENLSGFAAIQHSINVKLELWLCKANWKASVIDKISFPNAMLKVNQRFRYCQGDTSRIV